LKMHMGVLIQQDGTPQKHTTHEPRKILVLVGASKGSHA
jgi:hypothetical protein